MPELPDVETLRRFLNRTANRQTIERVAVRDQLILRGVPARRFQAQVKGKKFASTLRHGKYIFVSLQPAHSRNVRESFLVFHFGMTGYLRSFARREPEPEYNRVIFHLSNGVRVAFNCRRRLGSIWYTEDREEFIARRHLGPDALRIDFQDFRQQLEAKKGSIKCVLMDQSVVSGIGNIYADETLFQARIHPQTPVTAMDAPDKKKLFEAIHSVLHKAVALNANPARFPRMYLNQYRHPRGLCPRCRVPLTTIRACGRTAYLCPREQLLKH